jgi:hypothetical protein
MQHVYIIQYGYLLNKYLKCSVWRLAVRCGTATAVAVRRQTVKGLIQCKHSIRTA